MTIQIPESNIYKVKYENLIKNLRFELEKIFSFLQLPKTEEFAQLALSRHIRTKERIFWSTSNNYISTWNKKRHYNFLQEVLLKKSLKDIELRKKTFEYFLEYYGTSRSKNFDPDHWLDELPKGVLERVMNEPECLKALKQLNYTIKI